MVAPETAYNGGQQANRPVGADAVDSIFDVGEKVMRKYQLFAVLGVLLVVAGFTLMLQSPTMAQDAPAPLTSENPIDPPYLGEFYLAWVASPHADKTAEAFNHWNEEADKVVPDTCAKCHSTPGYQDFIGADGSEINKVDAPAPLGTVVSCDACHNSVTSTLRDVPFPSGAVVTTADDSSRCVECHQGRAWGGSVDAAIEKAGLTDGNTVSDALGFVNIHYFAAAASLYGSEVSGGYQFAEQVYTGKNAHYGDQNTCIGCHDPHTLEVKVETCGNCHEDVASVEDLVNIRMQGSLSDYDGDGDTTEGIAQEIAGLQEMLMAAVQGYAKEISGAAITYNAAAYPYFFADANDNGAADEGEGKYVSWTGNLLKAAYNYQVSMKDPGAFAHNPEYTIELLFDSISMLNAEISAPVDMSTATRDNPGHFDATGEPFRHWDEEGEVPGGCARCHSGEGVPVFLKNGVNIAAEPANGFACTNCHNPADEFNVYAVKEVKFPSGAAMSFGEGDPSNLCLVCHQGRESTVSVNTAIKGAGVGDDEVSEKLTFRNIHYFAAGVTKFGADAKGAYQFTDKEYSGLFVHDGEDYVTCIACHDQHQLTLRVDECSDCHEDVETAEDVLLIRQEAEGVDAVDYNGNGDVAEPVLNEIVSFQDALYAAIQKYAAETVGKPVAYTPAAHPYWYYDTNANGTADAEEINRDNRFLSFTPNLLRAAYNYQFSMKDPGNFAHNADYTMQVLFDSIEALGGDVSSFVRPPVVPSPAK